jgi:alpha-beta hydrolase superfamily lysophospholipase
MRARLRRWFGLVEADGRSFLDRKLVSERLFFPRTCEARDAFFVNFGDNRLACLRQVHAAGAGTVLHFHGNGEVAADYLDGGFAGMLSEMGVNACFAEYRGYGMSSGSPSLTTMLEDGEQIVRALNVPLESLVVYGRSIGSLYAIELVQRFPTIAGLVLESGIADVLERLLMRVTPDELNTSAARFAREVSRHFDHRTKLKNYRGSLLVLHAKHDHTVDASHGQRLYDWAGGDNKRLVVFPDGDHNSLIAANYGDYYDALKAFLHRLGMARD